MPLTKSQKSTCPTDTPWGKADSIKELVPEGIWHVSTPSHGGIYVAPELWRNMPEYMRSTPYSQDGWFEEAMDWCLPFVVFETLLGCSDDVQTRRAILNCSHLDTFKDSYHDARRAAWQAHSAAPKAFLTRLAAYGPCAEAFAWAQQFDDWQTLWNSCDRADWMLWILVRLGRQPTAQWCLLSSAATISADVRRAFPTAPHL